MKKLSFVLLLTLTLFLGCSKENSDDNTQTVNRSANLLGPGDSANDILSDNKFKNMLIEIAYVKGYAPTETAISNFVEQLNERIHKDDISLVYKELPSPEKDSLSVSEISDLEKENRTVYNDGDTLGLYIYFTDASSEDDNPEEDLVTLGAVYRNTSMVIYEATIRKLASRSSLITNSTVETATLNHEAGHLFGLVDLGTTPVNDHQDPDAKSHCNEENCLMRAELQFGWGMAKMLTSKNGATPSFGVECIRDLQSNGGK
ncbi:hypothetical protein EHW67_13670 [Arenibacter aquaticus]|uniref:Membrane metalloprotease n=1 Tax=Arenibacter aquaticus TaxID=2489054 RepID=A0A430K0Q4_9FLAO|nr:hypothetical protein [Arenibacter aquaticus]RTE52721.1 hypothetical protein EHW67_13670 [Arenibacter aquaticus]